MRIFLSISVLFTIVLLSTSVSSWLLIKNVGCSGQNNDDYRDLTLIECRNKCEDQSNCKSIEYWPDRDNYCVLSETCSCNNLDYTHTAANEAAYGPLYFVDKEGNNLDCGQATNNKWTKISNAGCSGQNDKTISDISLQECKTECTNYAEWCSGIEYYPSAQRCQISTTCTCDKLDYYSTTFNEIDFYDRKKSEMQCGLKALTTETWTELVWSGCSGQNMISFNTGLSLTQCKAKCNNMPFCVSIEHALTRNTKICQLSSTCTYKNINWWGDSHFYDRYASDSDAKPVELTQYSSAKIAVLKLKYGMDSFMASYWGCFWAGYTDFKYSAGGDGYSGWGDVNVPSIFPDLTECKDNTAWIATKWQNSLCFELCCGDIWPCDSDRVSGGPVYIPINNGGAGNYASTPQLRASSNMYDCIFCRK